MILYSFRNSAEEFKNSGGKAYKLAQMSGLKLNVPKFICVSENISEDEISSAVNEYFKEDILFSVRSSATAEDGEKSSFAGQFETLLNVRRNDIIKAVNQCFTSAGKENVKAYLKSTGINNFKMNVIIQEMVEPDFSGVFFTQNPLGILSESVIIVGKGLGCNVVEDKTETTSYYYSYPDKKEYFVKQGNSPEISADLRNQLIATGKLLEKTFGNGLDIEFAVKNDTLYFLQARPITTINRDKTPLVLDNSNICESYPGITLPLTDSFIKTVYNEIFIRLVERLSGSDKITSSNKEIFNSMVESYNGRIFYNINSWYFVLNLLPFSKKIIPVWQEMLGVTEDMPIPQFKKTSFFTKTAITFNFIGLLFSTPKKMKKLKSYFEKVDKQFTEDFNSELAYYELYKMYEDLRSGILQEWDITLANDMYTFIMTALFRKNLRRKGMSESECNSHISGIQNIESMKPIRSLMELAVHYKNNGEDDEYRRLFNAYINKFGDRSIGELKLETETFRERPDLLSAQIKAFASTENIEEQLRKISSENEKISGFFAKRAVIGIANREFSRMNRSRLYGFARKIFFAMGKYLYKYGRIDDVRDVFYLTTEELSHGMNLKVTDYTGLIAERKALYASYESMPAYKRVIFSDRIVNKPICSTINNVSGEEKTTLSGVPCSSGKVKGSVIIVEEANYSIDTVGKIIVTHSTDPGWVFLLANAKGIIAEKGSLLSHTAIISRELKIPSIVGVENATVSLKNGDLIEMDCDTGIIRKL